MTLAFTDQRSNNNKNEEPKQEEVNQEEVNQELNQAMVGANGVNNFDGEGAGDSAGGANMGSTGGDESTGSGEKKHDIGAASGAVTHNAPSSGAGVETVLQVPPPVALVEEPGTTYMPMGMRMEMEMGVGRQSGAKP
jgi:hypothetical protein